LKNGELNIVFIGLGSNEGNKIDNIRAAIKAISKLALCKIEKVSSLYETFPLGEVEQDNFINAVIKIKTSLNPTELFGELKKIEQNLGRIVREKWGPREIDLDILFFNDLIFSDEIITLPHKGIIYRDFVIVPLIEIEPEFVHPVYKKNIADFLLDLKTKNIINKLPESLFTEDYFGIK
jgi:2-amino-4-hydroxy-6-hydroxymethyldihydropteridine diphosphokinase